jgi:hypothetical protein
MVLFQLQKVYIALDVTRVVIIHGYLRGWKEVVVADFKVLSSLGSLR